MTRPAAVGSLILALVLCAARTADAASRYAVANGNWNKKSTWSATSGGARGASVPAADDDVYIGEGPVARTVTIPGGCAAACASLRIGSNRFGGKRNLVFADASSSLTVSGSLMVYRPISSGTNGIRLEAGRLTVNGSLYLARHTASSKSGTRISSVTMATGSLTVGGDLVLEGERAAQSQIVFSGAGTLNLAGAFRLSNGHGTLTPSTGTVNFNGSSAEQRIPIGVSEVRFNHVAINGTGGGAVPSASITGAWVGGNLAVQSGIFTNGGFAIALASGRIFSVSNGAAFRLGGTSSMVAVSGGGARVFAPTSTVDYCGTTQTVASGNYGNLILSGSGTKHMEADAAVAHDLSIGATARADVPAGAVVQVGTLTLGGTNKAAGTWGSGVSSARHKNDRYFAATTGMLNVRGGGNTPGIFGGPSRTIVYGTPAVTLTGAVVGADALCPAPGESVRITINGVSRHAVIGGTDGVFSTVFSTAAFDAAPVPYSITYVYDGNDDLNAVTNSISTLTVNRAELKMAAGGLLADNKVYDGTVAATVSNVVTRFALAASTNLLGPLRVNQSGCCSYPPTGELLVVINNPCAIQVYTQNGVYRRSITMVGFDDTEAICLVNAASNLYAVAEERRGTVCVLTIAPNTTTLNRTQAIVLSTGQTFPLNNGLEGIAYDAAHRCFYLGKEYNPMAVYRLAWNPNGVSVTTPFDAQAVFGGWVGDIADLCYDPVSGHLFILHQDGNRVSECTTNGLIVASRSVSGAQPEGLSLSADRRYMFLVGEPNQFFRYERQTLPALSGTIPGDDVAVGGTPVFSFASAAAGTAIPVTATGYVLSGADRHNYSLAPLVLSANIAARSLRVKADDKTRPCGATNPVFTVGYDGFATGETEANLAARPTAACTATVSSSVGVYPIVPAGGAAANYSFLYGNGALTVTRGTPVVQTLPVASPLDLGQRLEMSLLSGGQMVGAARMGVAGRFAWKTANALPPSGVYTGDVVFTAAVTSDYFTVDLRVPVVVRGYADWIAAHGLSGDDALPGSDPDGDGFTNEEEFIAGSAPTNSQATLEVISLLHDGRRAQVDFLPNLARRQYRLRYTDSLGAGPWMESGWCDGGAELVFDKGDWPWNLFLRVEARVPQP